MHDGGAQVEGARRDRLPLQGRHERQSGGQQTVGGVRDSQQRHPSHRVTVLH